MDKRQRDISESGQVGGYPVPSDWEVTPVQKQKVYTEAEVIALLDWMQNIKNSVATSWSIGDKSSTGVLQEYNNQKQ